MLNQTLKSRNLVRYIHTLFIFTTILLTGISNPLRADESKEELLHQLQNTSEDTTRIKILFKIGNMYVDGPSDSLVYYFEKAEILIDSLLSGLGDDEDPEYLKRLKYRAILEIGIENFYQGEYTEALTNYNRCLTVARELNDQILESEVYEAIAIVLKNQGEYSRALVYYDYALEAAIATADTFWMATCYVNIGNVHIQLTNFSKAYEFLHKGLDIFVQLNHMRRIAVTNMNIGNLFEAQLDYEKAKSFYNQALESAYQTHDNKTVLACLISLGNVYNSQNQYKRAREYFEKAISINDTLGFSLILDESYLAIAKSYQMENEFEQAIEYFEISLELAREQNDKVTIASIHAHLADIYIKKKDYQKAIQSAEESLKLSLESENPILLMNAYLYLSEAWDKLGNRDKSFDYYRKYSAYKDTVFNAQKYKSVRDLEMKYEVEKQEQQMALLEEKNQVQDLKMSRRNRLYYVTLIGIGLILIIGYILIRNQRLRTKHRAIELEQKLMRSQMNPHFIFNSLIAIQSYIYKKDPVNAGDYLAKFADLIRITLENSRTEFVSFEKELKMLTVYLELQNLRFENLFDYHIDKITNLDPARIKIPPMMAQPFIENAIEHGLRHKKEKGSVRITFARDEQSLKCEVNDDGVGREKSKEFEKKRQHQSMATSITKERLEILSKKFGQKFTLDIVDLKDEKNKAAGTKVSFNMPFYEEQ